MEKINIQNLDLYYNYDSRFKTVAVCFYFYFPFDEKYVPSLSMLCQMLQKTSKKYPTEEEFAYYLKSLYDASFSITHSRCGKMQSLRVSVSFVNPKYIKEKIDIIKESISCLFDSFLNPNFTLENLELEKDILKQFHQNTYNNKTKYAAMRFTNEMYSGEIQNISSYGTYDQVDLVTLDDIVDAYNMLLNSKCYMFVTGDIKSDVIVSELNNYDLSRFNKYEFEEKLEFVDSFKKEIVSANKQIDEQDINQTIMFIGYRSDIRRNTPHRFTLMFLSALLGEYFHSVLFQVIREEHNLAYAIGTQLNMDKGAIHVYAKISKDNIELIEKLVMEEIEKIQDGIIDDKVIELTKNAKANEILKNGDSPFNPLYDLQDELMGFGKISDEMIIEKYNNITKEDLQEAANMLVLDTIYVLKGKA